MNTMNKLLIVLAFILSFLGGMFIGNTMESPFNEETADVKYIGDEILEIGFMYYSPYRETLFNVTEVSIHENMTIFVEFNMTTDTVLDISYAHINTTDGNYQVTDQFVVHQLDEDTYIGAFLYTEMLPPVLSEDWYAWHWMTSF